jgi:hypothetical protein
MDPATITLLAFSSVLVVGSATVIGIVNYRRCVKPQTTAQGITDWARDVVSQNTLS